MAKNKEKVILDGKAIRVGDNVYIKSHDHRYPLAAAKVSAIGSKYLTVLTHGYSIRIDYKSPRWREGNYETFWLSEEEFERDRLAKDLLKILVKELTSKQYDHRGIALEPTAIRNAATILGVRLP